MKTLICVPCMDMIPTEFFVSAMKLRRPNTILAVVRSSLIYDARNQLARRAVQDGFDRTLWLDSDMVFEPDLFEKLSARLDEGKEMVTGLYFTRKIPIQPVIFDKCGYYEQEDGGIVPFASSFKEYPRDTMFKVEGCGFGGVMVSTDLIKRVADRFGLPFSPMLGLGEDLSFCGRVAEVGGEIWCDSTIKMGHVGYSMFTENVYLTQKGEKNGGDT